ncbi:hypothetical protein OS493_008144 [Desmophyllum pertusum]|uniref:HYR domain-containing protein n=1 Tax=Desmophyllum pertusum TaxID=174260 RepID=A0A9X0DA30_9CNID|nr:hypothetical protein OS493_008144 [Desmophyllum pertusum]
MSNVFSNFVDSGRSTDDPSVFAPQTTSASSSSHSISTSTKCRSQNQNVVGFDMASTLFMAWFPVAHFTVARSISMLTFRQQCPAKLLRLKELNCSFRLHQHSSPSITCPNSISVPTDPGKPTAKVSIPKASATDNNDQLPTITNNAGAESKEFIVSSVPHEVIYTATDAAGLSALCTLEITVSDQERPRVSSCPPDIKIQTELTEIRVTWDYPVFEDNFDKQPRISSNRNPGTNFPWGRYHVVYTATDQAGNEALVKFYVEVGRKLKNTKIYYSKVASQR